MGDTIGEWAAYYDALADDYDDDTAAMGWGPSRDVARLLAPLGLAPATVLDLGAGTGQTATAMAGLYPEAWLTLVEPSIGMASIAAAKHPEAQLVVSDADRFLAADLSTYDVVVAVGFLELVPDLLATLEAAADHVAPGGHLAITHEPLLDIDTVQGDAVTVLEATSGRRVRRHRRAALEAVAQRCDLSRVAAADFVAYQRGGSLDDVVYEAVVWRR